jgi:hypothetical protein
VGRSALLAPVLQPELTLLSASSHDLRMHRVPAPFRSRPRSCGRCGKRLHDRGSEADQKNLDDPVTHTAGDNSFFTSSVRLPMLSLL